MDIGILYDDRSSGRKVVRILPKNQNGQYESLEKDNPYVLLYCYPLIWSKGERGYAKNCGFKMPIYISSIYLRCERNLTLPSMLYPYDRSYDILTNRLQVFSRIGQVIIVDLISKMIDNQLKWINLNQDKITGGCSDYINENENNDDNGDMNINNDYRNDRPKKKWYYLHQSQIQEHILINLQ